MKKTGITALALAAALLLPSCSAVDGTFPERDIASENLDYVFWTLNDKEKDTLSAMIDAMNRRESEFPFPEGFDSDEMRRLFTLLYMEMERIFWLDSKFYCDEENRKLYLMYRYDERETAAMRAALDIEAGKIISGFKENASDYDKLLAIHDAIVLSSDFSKEGNYSSTAYGALVDGMAMCEGYAFAFSYLCTAAGIDNFVVSGTNNKGAPHLWNKVVCDGEWFNVDCTWDDPIFKNENKRYLRHDYFLVSDEEINGISHFPDESLFKLAPCTNKDKNYFKMSGLYFDSFADGLEGLRIAIKLAAVSKTGEAEIRFSNSAAYKEVYEYLFEQEGLKEIIEELNGNDGLKISSANKTVSEDLNIIHLSLVF